MSCGGLPASAFEPGAFEGTWRCTATPWCALGSSLGRVAAVAICELDYELVLCDGVRGEREWYAILADLARDRVVTAEVSAVAEHVLILRMGAQ